MGIGEGTIVNEGASIYVDDSHHEGHELMGPMHSPKYLDYEGCDIGKQCLIGCHVVIRNDVKIGDYTVLAHHAICEPNVEIGKATTLQVYAVLTSNSKLGDNCFIGPYFSTTNCFEQPPGPKGRHPDKKSGKLERQEIGNDVVIGANCCVAPGVTIGDNVEIGMNTFIKADVPSGESPQKPFKIRGGTVWSKKDLAYQLKKNAK